MMILKAAAETIQVESKSYVGGDKLTALMTPHPLTLNPGRRDQFLFPGITDSKLRCQNVSLTAKKLKFFAGHRQI